MDERVRDAGVREQPELAGAQALARGDEHIALADVLATRADVPTLADSLEDLDQVLVARLGVLLGDHRVGAGRDGRAGRDRDRLAHPAPRLRPLPDRRA